MKMGYLKLFASQGMSLVIWPRYLEICVLNSRSLGQEDDMQQHIIFDYGKALLCRLRAAVV